MKVRLAYGRKGLEVDLPEDVDIIQPGYVPGVEHEGEAIRKAIREPIESDALKSLVKPGARVVVVHTDITRATPNARLLPVILNELREAGVPARDIALLNGLGTHRRQTAEELSGMLGEEVTATYRCLQHDCYDDEQLVDLWETSLGNPVRVNKTYMEADVKILTGFIEPHLFAGFSGGPKAVLPSLAGYESVFSNHSQGMIAHPKATWGILSGNPIWEEIREVALRTAPTFLVNVTLNKAQEITAVFAGDMMAAHSAGTVFVKENAMAAVDEAYDVVVTSNSGYPLDQNLYQSVKGMSAAAQIVKQGGVIIMAAACEDGLPDHGMYAELLRSAGSPQNAMAMIAKPGFEKQDQWQVQLQAQIQLKAEVYVYSDGLNEEQIEGALFIPCADIEMTVANIRAAKGADTRVCVIPEGPQTIPYLR